MAKIERYKYYDEYTQEELKYLPPLKVDNKKNWILGDEDWEFAPRD